MTDTSYPKIATLFERKEDFSIDTTKLKRPVFATISEWDVTEKIDGTNIRVIYQPKGCTINALGETIEAHEDNVQFRGRTDNAILPGDLHQNLMKLFPVEKLSSKFQTPVILYGEGYGAGIQKVGKLYRPDKSFILFDVKIGDWWMNTQEVQDVANSLEIDVVPYLGRMSFSAIVGMVERETWSYIPGSNFCPREGIVARPIETLFDSRHERVIFKLKTKDFQAGKR